MARPDPEGKPPREGKRDERGREKSSDGGGEGRRERTIEEEEERERDRKGDCAGVKRHGIDRERKRERGE